MEKNLTLEADSCSSSGQEFLCLL